ncbi:MAG: hypothetical protein IPO56_11155 [Flavobacteriales bacterium]|nr:hypothetical protein [Flavobacteriales bacterium]
MATQHVPGGWGGKPYLAGDRLYDSTNGGPVYCMDAATGTTIYELPSTGTVGEVAEHFLVVNGVLLANRFARPSVLEARNALTGDLIWTGAPLNDLTSPMVLVDDAGTAHYCTASGMQQ